MIAPKKKLIDASLADGSFQRMEMLLSASVLLLSEANSLIEEASDLMEAHGLLLGEIKRLHNVFVRSADQYFASFAQLVPDRERRMDYFRDLDGFDLAFRRWAKIEAPRPEQDEAPAGYEELSAEEGGSE